MSTGIYFNANRGINFPSTASHVQCNVLNVRAAAAVRILSGRLYAMEMERGLSVSSAPRNVAKWIMD
jgi:hypothetical protein